jgi:hypothetical protein
VPNPPAITDLVEARFELDDPVALDPGSYWLALHEGEWLAPGDAAAASHVFWQHAASRIGDPIRIAVDETAPCCWSSAPDFDSAFALYGDGVIWDQAAFDGAPVGVDISDNVVANRFLLAQGAEVSSFEVYLTEEALDDDDGALDTFSGVLSWALYADAGTPPSRPAALVDSGTAAEVLAIDTGEQSFWSSDLVRLRVRLGRSVTLPPGTHWLALHEGDWLSESDGSSVLWVTGQGGAESTIYWDPDETAPGDWPFNFGPGPGSAFALSLELIFGSGFEAGVTCAWSNGLEVDCL